MNAANLDRLASIINGMKKAGKLQILGFLHAQDSLDRESLDYLFDRTVAFDYIFTVLAIPEFSRFLKKWKDDELAALLAGMDAEQLEKFRQVLGKAADAAILAKAKRPLPASALGELIRKRVREGWLEGWLPRGGLMDIFLDLPCVAYDGASEGEDREEVRLRVLNPLVNPGEAILVILHAPRHAGRELRLVFRTDPGKEPEAGGGWSRKIRIGDEGFAWLEEPTDSGQDSSYPVSGRAIDVELWLDKSRYALRRVYALGKAKSRFRLDALDVEISGPMRRLVCRVSDREGMQAEGKALALLFCPRCGGLVTHRQASLEEGRLVVGLDSPRCAPAHPEEDLLLYLRIGEHGLLGHVDLHGREEARPGTLKTQPARVDYLRVPDSELRIALPPGPPDETILVLVSGSEEADRRLRGLMASSAVVLHSRQAEAKKTKASFPSPLGEFACETVVFLAQRLPPVGFRVFHRSLDNCFSWSPPRDEAEPGDRYFSFYRSAAPEPRPFFACRALLPETWLSIPGLPGLLEGEEAAVPVQYRAARGSKLRLEQSGAATNAEATEVPIEGPGSLEVMVRYGAGLLATFVRPDGSEAKTERLFDAPTEETVGIGYLPWGGCLEPEQGTLVELLPGIGGVRQCVLEDFLYAYPMGCGEQTAARITAAVLLSLETRDPEKSRAYSDSLNEVLFPHWMGFRRDGLFSVFGQDHSPAETRIVYANLRPLVAIREKVASCFPELGRILEELEAPVGMPPPPEEAGTDLGWAFSFNPSRQDRWEELLRLSAGLLLEDEKGRLGCSVENRFFHIDPILCGLAEAALATGSSKASITRAVARRRRIARRPLPSFLEELGLIERRYEKAVARRLTTIDDFPSYLLGRIQLRKSSFYFPSTVFSVAFLSLLDRAAGTVAREAATSYRFKLDGKETEVDRPLTISRQRRLEALSNFCFYKWTRKASWTRAELELSERNAKGNPDASDRHSDTRLERGQIWNLEVPRDAGASGRYLSIRVPAVLEPLVAREGSWDPTTGSLLVYRPDSRRIGFRALRPGRGHLFCSVVDMYDHRSAQRSLRATVTVE